MARLIFSLLFILFFTAVQEVTGDATSDCQAAASNCDEFIAYCSAGCGGGWSVGCGQNADGTWVTGTVCGCEAWTGIQPPRVEQTDDEFLTQAYDQHNEYRLRHGSPFVERDATLEATAQAYAEVLAAKNQMVHSGADGLGENLYASYGKIVYGKDGVDAWYAEYNNPGYDFNNPGFSTGTGHFTQVVWKSSTKIGCGRATASTGTVYVVCNYSPQGNVQGLYEENVLRERVVTDSPGETPPTTLLATEAVDTPEPQTLGPDSSVPPNSDAPLTEGATNQTFGTEPSATFEPLPDKTFGPNESEATFESTTEGWSWFSDQFGSEPTAPETAPPPPPTTEAPVEKVKGKGRFRRFSWKPW